MEDRLAAFESAVLSVKDRRIGFFVVTGPRHQYIDRVLALETQGRLQNFAIYAAGMFRPESFKAVENVKAGAFSPGSNISIFNKIIYSDHCLSIGAGDKELWCYRTANSHD